MHMTLGELFQSSLFFAYVKTAWFMFINELSKFSGTLMFLEYTCPRGKNFNRISEA